MGAGSWYWLDGLVLLFAAGEVRYFRKKGGAPGLRARLCLATALMLLLTALVLELLPGSAVLVFADGPESRIVRYYSCFDRMLVGYANFGPPLSGVLTVCGAGLSTAALCSRKPALRTRRAAFLCVVLGAAASCLSPLLFGSAYWTRSGVLISVHLLAAVCLLAVANSHRAA